MLKTSQPASDPEAWEGARREHHVKMLEAMNKAELANYLQGTYTLALAPEAQRLLVLGCECGRFPPGQCGDHLAAESGRNTKQGPKD